MIATATQLGRVRTCMSDHRWHTLAEIRARCIAWGAFDSEAAISARIRDLRKGGREVARRRRGGTNQREYRLVPRTTLF